jgi:hypothetical protein
MTPLQQAHAQLQAQQAGGAATPLQQAHAQLQAQRAAASQGGLQRAQLISLMAQMGPQPSPGGGGGAGTGFGGALLGALLGGGGVGQVLGGGIGFAVGGPPGALVGSLLGKLGDKGVAMAQSTMQGREEREVGLLQLGDTLNQQFGDLRDTMERMRRNYQILGMDGVRAMTNLARATGQVDEATVLATARVGRFYGMSVEESLGTQAAFQLAGVREPQLATGALLGERVAARFPGAISAQRFLMEAPRIAAAGELAAPAIPENLSYRYGEFMAGFDDRYAAHPAQAFQERFQGFQQPRGQLGQVLQVQAIDRLRQRQRFVNWNGRPLDLNDPEDMRVAQENFGDIPVLEDSLRHIIRQQTGTNQSLARFYYGAAAGASATRAWREWPGGEAYAREHGSIAAGLGREIDPEEAHARLTIREMREGGQVGREALRARTAPEEASELAPMRAWLDAQLAAANAAGSAAQAFNEGKPFLEAIGTGMRELSPLVRDLVEQVKRLTEGGGLMGWIAGNLLATGGAVAGLGETAYGQAAQNFGAAERQKLLGWLEWFTHPDTTQQQPRKPR